MNNFRYYLPTEVLGGRGCVRIHADKWCLGHKALIVTGHASAQTSGALDDVVGVLTERGIAYTLFDGISANPDDAQVYAGAAAAAGCDFIIAIGGGSPLDAAKSIAWVVASNIPQADFFQRAPKAEDAVLPIVAIPLTCGTGSEVTPYSIITNHAAKTKTNVSCATFFPKVALLDSRYLESLPQEVLCDTALDALSHAIEGAYSPRANRMTLAMSEEAVRTIFPELTRMAHSAFVNLSQLQYAAMLAGCVIAQTGTGLVHAMGYPLTYYKGLPHGRANGILLAGYLERMEGPCAEITKRLITAMGLEDFSELQALVDALLDLTGADREAPTEEELARFALEPLRLSAVKRYRTMHSPEEIVDIYRTGF